MCDRVIRRVAVELRTAGCLCFRSPSNPKQCLIDAFRFAAGPLAHKKCIDFGGFLRCSVRSASTRRARATAATSASRCVGPYAITPGSSGISASQRPSSSCSNSTLNDSEDSESGGCGGFGWVAMSAQLHDGYGGGRQLSQRIYVLRGFKSISIFIFSQVLTYVLPARSTREKCAWELRVHATAPQRNKSRNLAGRPRSRLSGFCGCGYGRRVTLANFGKPLHGDKGGLWRYRVGDYRLICDIQDERITVLAIRVGHRKDVYR